jgi:predicted MFS family arabinose efflux permease
MTDFRAAHQDSAPYKREIAEWRSSLTSPEHIEPDPAEAWLMAAMGFVALFTTFGILYGFGAFLRPMMEDFRGSNRAVSGLFSTVMCLGLLLGPFTGRLSDQLGARPVLAGAALSLGLSLVLTALVKRLWLAYLTFGAGLGIAVSCTYVPALVLVGTWFRRHRDAALGLAVAGIGCGTLAVAPLEAALIERCGWRGTFVILGLVGCLVMLGCAAISKNPPVPAVRPPSNLARAIRVPAFGMLYAGGMLFQIGQFISFTYLAAFARYRGVDPVAAATLVGLIGASSVIGRFGLAALTSRFGVVRLYQATVLTFALSYAIWLFARGYASLAAFALVMGTSYGGFVALSPAVAAQLFGIEGLGALLGTLYTSGAIGVLLGPPLAGLLIDRTGGYQWAIAFAMATSFAAFVTFLPLSRARPA